MILLEKQREREKINEKLKEFGLRNIKKIERLPMKKCIKCDTPKKLWSFGWDKLGTVRKDVCKDCEAKDAPVITEGEEEVKKRRGRKKGQPLNKPAAPVSTNDIEIRFCLQNIGPVVIRVPFSAIKELMGV